MLHLSKQTLDQTIAAHRRARRIVFLPLLYVALLEGFLYATTTPRTPYLGFIRDSGFLILDLAVMLSAIIGWRRRSRRLKVLSEIAARDVRMGDQRVYFPVNDEEARTLNSPV